jgi:hypothetical protein
VSWLLKEHFFNHESPGAKWPQPKRLAIDII